jgi:hypothetical protein
VSAGFFSLSLQCSGALSNLRTCGIALKVFEERHLSCRSVGTSCQKALLPMYPYKTMPQKKHTLNQHCRIRISISQFRDPTLSARMRMFDATLPAGKGCVCFGVGISIVLMLPGLPCSTREREATYYRRRAKLTKERMEP